MSARDELSRGLAQEAAIDWRQRLVASAGASNVQRQHMGKLQHNKLIAVDGRTVQSVRCGSNHFSWRCRAIVRAPSLSAGRVCARPCRV